MKAFYVVGSLIFLMGCASGHCRSQYVDERERPPSSEESIRSAFSPPEDKDRSLASDNSQFEIYKPDGSKQCGMGKAVAVDTMEQQLKGLQVLARRKGDDGQMHMTLCGGATGDINVYTIKSSDWPAAEKLGFKKLVAQTSAAGTSAQSPQKSESTKKK